MDFFYSFPAVEGIQAGRQYYIAMLPLRMLPKVFEIDGEYIQPEFRAQRRLNEQRIPEICSYILDNPDTYVFSALAASVDGEMEFLRQGSGPLGTLNVSFDATFLINDGQHRVAAILEALKENEEIGSETISVVLYEDLGLSRSQQMFTDLNKHAVRTTNSIAELYDSRDPLAVATREAVKSVELLDRYTDKERDNLGKNSASLFTLNMFYKANRRIVGQEQVDGATRDFLIGYWRAVSSHMIPWQEMDQRRLSKRELREQTIAVQAVCLQALGRVGAAFYSEGRPLVALEYLESVDWYRSSPAWSDRTISNNGRIITNNQAVCLTANVIKKALQLPLSDEDVRHERKLATTLEKRRTDA